MNTHIDPQYLNPADMPDADAPASVWVAYWQRELDAATTPEAIANAEKRLAFWRGMVKPDKLAPLTNEQRKARRKERGS